MSYHILEVAERVVERDFQGVFVDDLHAGQLGGAAILHLVIAFDAGEVVGDLGLVDRVANAFPGILEVVCGHIAAVMELGVFDQMESPDCGVCVGLP